MYQQPQMQQYAPQPQMQQPMQQPQMQGYAPQMQQAPAGTPGWLIGLGVAAVLALAAYVLKLGPFAPATPAPGTTIPPPAPGTTVTPPAGSGITGVTQPPATRPVTPVAPAAPVVTYPTNWSCVGDIDVPVRRENNANKDISCMSTNGRDCVWGGCASRLAEFSTRQNEMQPLVCGAMHQGLYGDGGYGNPIHWCYKGNNLIPKA